MCVIITTPNRKHRPTLETLRACERTNPHGSGVAWVQDKRVQWIKGLSAEAISSLLDVLKGEVVIHFRIASAGGVKASLCHPFPISPLVPLKATGQAGRVLFHNGHWGQWEAFAKAEGIELEGPVSDTRVIAAGVHQLGSDLLKSIPCRFVILSERSGTERFGEWSEIGGCHFSNLYWKGPKAESRKQKAETGKSAIRNPQSAIENPVLDFSVRTGRRLNLVEEAMACFGD